MTNDYEPFYNFWKILFYEEYFLFHAKLKNSPINFHVVPYGLQIGVIHLTLSLILKSKYVIPKLLD